MSIYCSIRKKYTQFYDSFQGVLLCTKKAFFNGYVKSDFGQAQTHRRFSSLKIICIYLSTCLDQKTSLKVAEGSSKIILKYPTANSL